MLLDEGFDSDRFNQDLGQSLQRSGDNFLFDTFSFFLSVEGQILAGDTCAWCLLDHVRVGSEARAGHNAPKKRLNIDYQIGFIMITMNFLSSWIYEKYHTFCIDFDSNQSKLRIGRLYTKF